MRPTRARPRGPTWRGGLLRALGGGLALALLASACGHTGRPIAPLPRVPATPADVVWEQRGDELTARARARLEGPGGRALREPVRPVLLLFAPQSAALTGGWDTPARAREFLRTATRVPGAPLDAGGAGGARDVALRVPLSELPEAAAYVVALALEDAREISLPSARVVLRPLRPKLGPPARVQIEPLEEGIRIAWGAPGDERATVVALFRASGGAAPGARPWRLVPAAGGEYVDADAVYGETYAYAVAFAAGSDVPLVLSDTIVAGGPVAYRDVFPPRPPRELDAVAGSGRIRVFWFEGGSDDEALVEVERSAENGPWSPAGRVEVPDAFYEDRDVSAGATYRYRARAVDREGNPSEWTGPAGPIAPRPAP